MLTCKQLFAQLNNPEEPRDFKMKFSMWLHLLMCKHCSAYKSQLETLGKVYRKYFHQQCDCSQDEVKEVEDNILKKLSEKYNK